MSAAAPAPAPRLPDPALAGAAAVLVRHGETAANRAPLRFQGRLDEPLNDPGRRQAAALAASADGLGFRVVWSSDLARARETAAAVTERQGLELGIDARLAESHRGRWEGRPVAEVAAAEPALYAAWRAAEPGFRFPGGESLVEHRDRAHAALAEILAGPSPALVVCHGGTIRVLVAPGLERFHEPSVPNCAAFAIDSAGVPIR